MFVFNCCEIRMLDLDELRAQYKNQRNWNFYADDNKIWIFFFISEVNKYNFKNI